MRFTALLHHITPEALKQSYFALKRKAAAGVDGVTWRQYGQDLWERRKELLFRSCWRISTLQYVLDLWVHQ
jgi:hypothetical protein